MVLLSVEQPRAPMQIGTLIHLDPDVSDGRPIVREPHQRPFRNIISELRGCGFVSLGHSWRDTTTDVGRLVLAKG
jgi:hypothetical protein